MKNIIETILLNLEDRISSLIKKEEIRTETSMSEYAKEYFALELTFEMVSALEKYLNPNDVLINMTDTNSVKGFVVGIDIERDGVPYHLQTDVIVAGGYNIQRIHYRYITKTKLPMKKIVSNVGWDKG